MEYGPDIICPKCATRHGPAATRCECGYVFEVPVEDPAPAKHFYGLAVFFGVVGFLLAKYVERSGNAFMPLGALIFMATSLMLGLRSSLYFAAKKRKDSQPD
ncbi:MAG: hypothetical protein K0Q55_2313 [Verrucomicrobia bacterium]|jgi:hypothetical protein|nr:hypothetical protein [Verrucomicrobiota bacterium]